MELTPEQIEVVKIYRETTPANQLAYNRRLAKLRIAGIIRRSQQSLEKEVK